MAEEVTGQPAAEPSVDELAASVAKGILAAEEGPPRDEKGKFTKAQPGTEATAEEPQQTEEPQEEAQQPEVDWEALKGVKRKLTVKAEDGTDQEVELTLEEMEKGVMLEKSYRQKTAQLAREREALQAKVKEAVEPKLREYDEKLQMAEVAIWHTLAPEIQNVDWNRLANEDPAEWARKYQHVQNVNARLAQVRAERQKIAEAAQAEAQANRRRQAEEAVEVLKTEIPGWNNELYGKILKTAVEHYGFKTEEVAAITDHRAIKLLNDAMQFRALKAKPIVEKRAAAPVPKVVKPGTAEKPDAGAEKWKEGMAKLRKSGRTEDAVEVAKMLLARGA